MNKGKKNAYHKGVRNMDQMAAGMRGRGGDHRDNHTDETLEEFRSESRICLLNLQLHNQGL